MKILERIKGLLLSIPHDKLLHFIAGGVIASFFAIVIGATAEYCVLFSAIALLYQGGCRRVEEAGGLVVCRLAGDHTGRAGDSNRGLDCLTKKMKNGYEILHDERTHKELNGR